MIFILLFLFWVLLNGRWTPDVLITGAVVCGALDLALFRLCKLRIRTELLRLRQAPLFFAWVVLMLFEIVKANLAMLPFVLFGRKPRPEVVQFVSPLESPGANLLLSASITLTPGTVTASMHERNFEVHCFDRSMGKDLTESRVCRLLGRMERIGRKGEKL